MANRKAARVNRTSLAERLHAAVALFKRKKPEEEGHARCSRCRIRFRIPEFQTGKAPDWKFKEFCSETCARPAPLVGKWYEREKPRTRQMIREELWQKSRANIEQRHGGGESAKVAAVPRRNRRRMIRNQAARWWRERKAAGVGA